MDQWIYPNRLANYREQKLLERENQKRSATPDAKAASPEKPDRIKQESPAATSPLQSDIESPDSLLFVPSNDVDVPKRDEAQVTNEESRNLFPIITHNQPPAGIMKPYKRLMRRFSRPSQHF